jgi:hypothetical protein
MFEFNFELQALQTDACKENEDMTSISPVATWMPTSRCCCIKDFGAKSIV